MAVSTTDTYSGPYAANGVTVAFPFTFKAVSTADVAIIFRASDGSETVADDDLFTVVLASEGGTVTFSTAPLALVGDVFIVSEPAFIQSVEFASGQPFLPSVVNEVNDRDVVRALYLKGKIDRAPQTPIGGGAEGQFPTVLPDGSWGFSSGTGNDPAFRADAASTAPDKGAALVGHDPAATYPDGSTGKAINLLNEASPWLLTDNGGAFAYLEANANTRTPARGPGIGHLTVARGSTSGAGVFALSIGAAHVAVNDFDNAGTFAQYSTGIQTVGRTSPLHMHEVDVAHLGSTVVATPQNINPPGLSEGLRLMSGGELPYPPYNIECKTATVALLIGVNDPTFQSSWEKGILFHEGFCESAAIALGTADKIVWFSSTNSLPETSINGASFSQYKRSDFDCYFTNTTRLLSLGGTPTVGMQLSRHDYFDHDGGTLADANVSVRTICLGGSSAGWQALGLNATGGLVGVGVHTQGDNSFAPVGVSGAIDLGAPGSLWNNVRAAVGTIQTSDGRVKHDLGPLPLPLMAALTELLGRITHGQFLAAIEEKGEEQARKHLWLIAQTIVDVCAEHGVDAFAYGFVGQDPWLEDYEEPYEDEVAVEEPVEVPSEEIEIIDGKAIVISGTKIEMRPKREIELLWNPDGSPAMEEVAMKPIMQVVDGELVEVARPPLIRQRARVVTPKVMVTKTRTASRQKVDEHGEPMMLLSVRTDEIFYGLVAALWAEVVALRDA